MTTPHPSARLPDLAAFDRANGSEGRLRAYTTRRTETLFERLGVLLVGLSFLAVLASPLAAFLAAAIALPATLFEFMVLRHYVRYGKFSRRIDHAAITLAGFVDALGLTSCAFFAQKYSDNLNLLSWALLAGILLNNTLVARFHRPTYLARCLAVAMGCAVLVIDQLLNDQIPLSTVLTQLAAVVLLVYLLRSFIGRVLSREDKITTTERELIVQSELAGKLALVAEHANDCVLIFDQDHRLTWVNPKFSEVTGFGFQEVIGRCPSEFLVHEDADPEKIAQLQTAAKRGHPVNLTLLSRRKDGAGIWLEISQTPILDGLGDVMAYVSVERDATESVTQKAKLERALKDANQAAEAKTAFLSRMSHELRTPVNGVMGALEVLREVRITGDEETQGEVQLVQDLMEEAAPRMVELIDNLLNFSDIEAGEVSVKRRFFDGSTLVQDVVEKYRSAASAKGLRLTVWTPQDGIASMCQDSALLRRLLDALMSNAIKFTEQGEVHVALKMQRDGTVRILVRDSGIGISEQDIGRIFKTFEQAEDGIARSFEGTGLGLALAYEISKLLRGKLTASSEPGQGSCFTLDIPQHLDSGQIEAGKFQGRTQTPPADLRLLVAEDSRAYRKTLETMIGHDGREVMFAHDGLEAVSQYRDGRPDIILMDLSMPKKGGLAAAREIRAWEAAENLPRVPIVAVTTKTSELDRRRCFEAGMDEMLAKPVRKERLMETLGRVLN